MTLSPRRTSGFIPIRSSHSDDTMHQQYESDIPLTQVKSHASSTGARRRNMGAGLEPQTPASPANEKSYDDQGTSSGVGQRKKFRGARRQRTGDETPDDEGSGLNVMGRIYKKIVNFSPVTRYLVYIIPVGLLLAIPNIVLPLVGHNDDIFLGSQEDSGRRAHESNPFIDEDEKLHGPPLFRLFLWIQLAWLTVWAGKIVAWLLPRIFMFVIGVVSTGTRKYAQVLHNLQIPMSLFFWALASWISFRLVFQYWLGEIHWIDVFVTILGASFTCAAVYLAEKTIVQLIGISYHQRSFALRIKASKREVYLVGLLYEASRALFPMYCPEFEEDDAIISDSIFATTGKKIGATAAPLKFVGNVGRVGDKVTAAFGNIASEITGKSVFNPNSAHSIVLEALERTKSSEALARRIWMAFVCEGRDSLYLEDVQEVLGPGHALEAEEAFEAIDGDANGDISMDEMTRKIVEISKERKAITEGMKDIGQALRVLDKVLEFIVVLICVFLFLLWFQSNLVAVIGGAGTALLSLSFVFAATTQEFLGSCIFLFVKHPYDVGDRVDIQGPKVDQLVVDKISLLYTSFTRIDKMQVVQVPNIVLNNLWIENVSRSKAMKEIILVNISFDTTFEDIELLRGEMEKFVQHHDNSRDFEPDVAMGVDSIGDLDKMSLEIVIKHKSNWHNEIVRATRRSKFMCALTLAMKKVPIYGPGGGYEALGAPGNPSYSVTVTDAEAEKGRQQAAADKEGLRMVPTATADANADETDSMKEKAAMANINHRESRNEEEWGYRMADDNDTLGESRPRASSDRRRSGEHGTDLMKRSSTRGGRRKAGETVPAVAGAEPGSPAVPRLSSQSPRLETFDEEAQTGTSPYGGSLGGYYNDQSGVQRTMSQSRAQAQGSYAPYRGPGDTLSPTQSRTPYQPPPPKDPHRQ